MQELLMSRLSGSTELSKKPHLLVNFNVGPENAAHTDCFNPFLQFSHIGKKKLNQVCCALLGKRYNLF